MIIIADEEVYRLHGEAIEGSCSALFDSTPLFKVPQGEESKSIRQWNKLLDALLKEGMERATPVLVVGGGVTGDLGGFVAASVLRGVPLIHMPTTLLAMVDSSIGGKTGINHPVGKNLVGDFYQPDAVFADLDFLGTLPEKEWVNGLSEVIKYGAIADPELFGLIDDGIDSGFEPSGHWEELVYRSAAIKIDVVQKDTLEAGIREYLNFGHTFGHALEKLAGYGTISHGEAVLTGMIAAVYASRALGKNVQADRLFNYLPLHAIDLPEEAQQTDALVEAMRKDKKVKQGAIRLVLLKEWGEPYIHACEDEKLLHEAWNYTVDIINGHYS